MGKKRVFKEIPGDEFSKNMYNKNIVLEISGKINTKKYHSNIHLRH